MLVTVPPWVKVHTWSILVSAEKHRLVEYHTKKLSAWAVKLLVIATIINERIHQKRSIFVCIELTMDSRLPGFLN